MSDGPAGIKVITLLGRLGNNLFQIALAKEFEKVGYSVYFDLSQVRFQKLDIYRMGEVGKYVKDRTLEYTRYLPTINGRYSKCGIRLRNLSDYKGLYIDLSNNGPDYPVAISESWLLGYFQRLSQIKTLQNEMKENYKSLPKINRISVHIRRGDFIGKESLLPLRYYIDSINHIRRITGCELLPVNLVTNDTDYCEKNFKDVANSKVISNNDALEDFHILACSEYLICSRSTFSLWAGYISEGTIIYPSSRNKEEAVVDQDTVPKNWIRIEASY